MALAVAAEVAAGRYASEADLALEGIAALLDDEDGAALEAWLRGDVVRSCQEMAADPSLAVPIDDVLPRIRSRARDRARSVGR